MENETDAQPNSNSPRYERVSLHNRCVNISRPVYDQASFDRQFGIGSVDGGPSPSLRDRVRSLLPSCDRSMPDVICRRVVRFFPVIEHLRNYRWRAWLLRDFIAGISSGVIHVPQVSGVLSWCPQSRPSQVKSSQVAFNYESDKRTILQNYNENIMFSLYIYTKTIMI